MDDVSFRAWESALLLLGCQNSFNMLLQNYCITRRDLAHFSRYNMDSRNHLLTKVALTLKKRLLLQNMGLGGTRQFWPWGSEVLMKTVTFSLQERDLELEMGDDYILDLQSKGSSVVV